MGWLFGAFYIGKKKNTDQAFSKEGDLRSQGANLPKQSADKIPFLAEDLI